MIPELRALGLVKLSPERAAVYPVYEISRHSPPAWCRTNTPRRSRMARSSGAKRSDRVDDTIFESLPAMHGNAAGIDIGSEKHYVSVPDDRSEQPTRTFGCFTPDILAIAQRAPGVAEGVRHSRRRNGIHGRLLDARPPDPDRAGLCCAPRGCAPCQKCAWS